MTSRASRTFRLLAAAVFVTGAAFALTAVRAPDAAAHSGPHDPSAGATLSITGGTDEGCQSKAPGAANCPKFEVSNCQGATEKRDGWFARHDPLGGTPVRAMLVIFSGGGGQSYWQNQASTGTPADQRVEELITDLRSAGFAIFQVRWGVDWPKADAGHNDGLHVACKPARILKYLYNVWWVGNFGNPSNATGVCGFCVMGTSGGSSAVAWMLTHFMADVDIDAAFPTGGPPHGNMSKGCVPSGPPEQPYDYGTGSSIQQIDNPFLGSTTPCKNNTTSFRSTWDAHSIGSEPSNGDHHHATTRVHLIDGDQDPLRFHGYDWMVRMWLAGSPYTTFERLPSLPNAAAGHSIYDTDHGMAALKAAITRTSAPRACGNGVDDDWDGQTDTADEGCATSTDVSEKGSGACDNALDDDGDGFADHRDEGGDPGCASAQDTDEASGGGPTSPSVSVNDVGGAEGQTGPRVLAFNLTLSQASTSPVSVQFTTGGGTATASSDYVPTSGTVTFDPGDVAEQVQVTVNGDALDEPDETLNLTLSNPSGATLGDATGVATIQDDDATPVLSVNSPAPGSTEGANLTFTVTMTGASASPVTFNVATANGSAGSSDYEPLATTQRSFPAGSAGSLSVTIATRQDLLDEPAETVLLNLSAPVNADIAPGQGQGTGTILDDDAAPVLSVDADSAVEGAAVELPVELDAASGRTVEANYTVAAGTAGSGDFEEAGGSISIPPGTRTATISVATAADGVDETDETITVTLSEPANATLGTASATGTILDDDVATIAITDASAAEGDPPGPTSLVFDVTLSTASDRTVSASWATAAEGAATPGEDYTTSAGTVTFAAGDTLEQVTVPLLPDETTEPDETFVVNLTEVSEGSPGDVEGVGTIVNDDARPTLGVTDPDPVPEGDPGATTTVDFAVTLSQAVDDVVTVGYGTISGTASEGDDFVSGDGGTVTFVAGDQTETVSITLVPDADAEADETFTLSLSDASSNAEIGDATATGTIANDDVQSELSVSDAEALEGQRVVFTASLDPAPAHDVVLTYSTANGSAVAPGDFEGSASGAVTVPAHSPSVAIDVQTVDDELDETDETFTLTVGSADPQVGPGGDRSATGTISDGDPEPAVSIADASANEGSAAAFVVTLSAASGKTVTVGYATAPGSATTADFGSVSGVITFAPLDTSETVQVATTQDAQEEPDEVFQVNLSGPVGAALLDAQGEGIIVDDDDVPTLSVADVTIPAEGAAGRTRSAEFFVKLSRTSSQPVTFNFATSDGTAVQPGDYRARTVDSSISPGTTGRRIVVTVNGDGLDEPDEFFNVTISGVVGAVVVDGTAVGTIVDDDQASTGVTISIADVTVVEPDAGSSVAARFKVTLSAASTQTITVRFATVDGSAIAASDYVAKTGTVTFTPGQVTRTVAVSVRGDGVIEPNEVFHVDLSQPTNATIADGRGQGTIQNDD